MDKIIYIVPTLEVIQFGPEIHFCYSLKDIPENEESNEAGNEGFFDGLDDGSADNPLWD